MSWTVDHQVFVIVSFARGSKVRSDKNTTSDMPAVNYSGQHRDRAGNLRALQQREMMLSMGRLDVTMPPVRECC